MKKFYINEISKISGLSVATLHYYDQIGLLQPSIRMENGYRLYSEADLIRLEKIIALKFFGFALKDIKKLTVAEPGGVMQELEKQSGFLAERAKDLANAASRIRTIIANHSRGNKVVDWKCVSKTIEVYKMTDEMRQTWVKDVLNEAEQQQYAEFKAGLKRSNQQSEASKTWSKFVEEIRNSLDQDPTSEKSQKLASSVMTYLNDLYGTENANLKKAIWEKGYKQGKVQDENGFTPEMTAWLDQALGHYWRNIIYSTLAGVGKTDEGELHKRWNKILTDMYGDQPAPKAAVYEKALSDSSVSDAAKAWLRKIR